MSPSQSTINKHRFSLERIAGAASVIDPVFLNSPQYLAETLGERIGCRVLVKIETMNPIRSFKGRGAEFFVASLTERPHLVCATAGNFGQGMAYAARKRGLPITIFVDANVNSLKIDRMRALGADVRVADGDSGAAAEAFATEHRARLVVDGRDAAIGEGAGTIGMELLRWPQPIDAIVVPLGDGSLLAGVSRWVKAHQPATQLIGVCAAGSPAMARSWKAGRVEEHEGAGTIAGGLAVTLPNAEALADITGLVDDVVLVEDETLVEAMRLAHRGLGLVLEPSGAAGLAALLAYRERFRGSLVSVILTGGNLTSDEARKWLMT